MICGYILAGGKNSRMNGEKKLFLTYQGETFCKRILRAFDKFPMTYISVEEEAPYRELGLPLVVDRYPECGPMGGIYSGLLECEGEALFVAACDMPMIDMETVQDMVDTYQKKKQITIACTMDGYHPLFGIYPKSVLGEIEKLLEKKCYKMMALLEKTGYQTVNLDQKSQVVNNINTVKEYQTLLDEKKIPFVFAVSGYKNSGKTTLLTGVIPELVERGYRVAVIKHDGHDFESDVPGTDSYRHQKAGAYGTAVFSEKRLMITKETTEADEQCLMKAFPEADIILLEGFKNSDYPKYFCRYPEEPNLSPTELADYIEKRYHEREIPKTVLKK